MPEAEVVAAPEAPPATPAAVAPSTPAPEAVAPGEKPAAGESPPPTGETPPVKSEESEAKRHRRQLNTAYRKAAEAQARFELLQRENEELKKPRAPDDGDLKLEQFDFDPEKYAAAKEKRAAEKALKEVETKQRQESQRQYQQRISAKWAEQVAEVQHDDFHEVVGNFTPSNPVLMAVMEAGPNVAYYLVKNTAEAQRIDALPLLAQIREIGKLEAKLAATPPTPKVPSRAPAPITPVTGSTAPAPKSLYDPNLDYDTFVKMRNKEMGRKSA